MSAKDRYVVKFECPKCKAEGSANVSEDDHPWIRSPGLSIDKLSEGFTSLVVYPDYHSRALLRCVPCGVPFQLFPQFDKPSPFTAIGCR